MTSLSTSSGKIYDFVAHASTVTCLKISPKSGRIMVSGGEDRKVNLWTIGRTEPVLSLAGHAASVESVALDWPEEIAVAGASSGAVKLWDLEHAKVIRTLLGHKGSVSAVEFHPFGEFFASGSDDKSVKIWDIRRKGCIQTYMGHQGNVTAIKISPDGRWVSTCGDDGMVKIWDMTAGKLLATLLSDANLQVKNLKFNPVEFLLAAITSDKRVRVFDLNTFESLFTSPAMKTQPQSVVFHTNGRELLVACRDSFQVWGVDPGECLDSLAVDWKDVVDINTMANGRLVGVSLNQNIASVWGIHLDSLIPYKSSSDQLPGRAGDIPTSQPKEITQQRIPPIQSEATSLPEDLSSKPLLLRPGSASAMSATPPPLPLEQSLTVELGLLSEFASQHNSMMNILSHRLDTYREIRQVLRPATSNGMWLGSGGSSSTALVELEFIECLERLARSRQQHGAVVDLGLWVDLLRIWNLNPGGYTLDVAVLLIPVLSEMILSPFEDFIITACASLRFICRNVGGVVVNAMKIGSGFVVDYRHEKCLRCYDMLTEAKAAVSDLRKTPGRVGSVIRDTLTELASFGP